ncbi:ATP-binding cassette domain-containing protein [Streptomyces sp. ODS28]|uniref:energy-coupling factor ABC transporter ATP-binding protein n=1 Tax=Streptomyces sp. ODS28 TaxID=3136688 RepID=UPI0031EA5A01
MTRAPSPAAEPGTAGAPGAGGPSGYGVPVVELAGAGYAYEEGPAVFEGVSFALSAGRRTALLGRNGSGKTTLLRLLSGGLPCTGGELRLEGAALGRSRKELTRLRSTVQLVLQDPDDQLFAASVGQDVSFGPMNLGLPEEEVRARVEQALESLDITPLRDRPTHLLSYGQRKRSAIAGAVAMRPRVLILDEPTAGLDPDGQERLLETLARLHEEGTTVVMATHDVDLALLWADDAAVLTREGVRTGPVDTLLADQDLLAAGGLRRPWGMAAAAALRHHGLLAPDAPGPRTAEQLDGWAEGEGTPAGTPPSAPDKPR